VERDRFGFSRFGFQWVCLVLSLGFQVGFGEFGLGIWIWIWICSDVIQREREGGRRRLFCTACGVADSVSLSPRSSWCLPGNMAAIFHRHTFCCGGNYPVGGR